MITQWAKKELVFATDIESAIIYLKEQEKDGCKQSIDKAIKREEVN